MTKILRQAPPYLYTLIAVLAICWLTLLPHPLPDSGVKLFEGADKVAHALIFGGLTAVVFYDMRRRVSPMSKPWCLFLSALAGVVAGGAVELLQGFMGLGRSEDGWDFVADCLGVAVVSALLWIFASRLTVRKCRRGNALERVHEIYMEAFPPEERRPWDSILAMLDSVGSPFSLTVAMSGCKVVGFITSWQFDRFVYIEHFAVDSAMRGKKIGARVLREFVRECRKPVVLEVEPIESGETARRRIGFYGRCGFHAFHDFTYIQPPYAPGLPSVPLTLMSNSREVNLDEVTAALHSRVYGKKTE